MKVHELIKLLQEKAHPKSEVNIYVTEAYGGDARILDAVGSEYVLYEIQGISDWGNPGSADDLTCINLGKLMGC